MPLIRSITVDGTAIAPASVAATGNITARGTANRFGPQTGGVGGTLYIDSDANDGVLQAIFWSTGTPFNAGKVRFAGGSNVVQLDNQSSSGYVALTFNGTDILKCTASAATSTVALVSNSATGGNGYSTGAGGTVTQATSKSTGVTLNKVCGQITMNNAALASGAKISFVVSNTSCAATDIPSVAVVSGGTANAYRANVTAVAANSFTITVENITAGSLSEAPVIGFAITKAVTS